MYLLIGRRLCSGRPSLHFAESVTEYLQVVESLRYEDNTDVVWTIDMVRGVVWFVVAALVGVLCLQG